MGIGEPLRLILGSALITNLALAVFNMMPIPPLDGGNVLSNLLPLRPGLAFDGIVGVYGGIILLALVLSGILNRVITPGTFTLANCYCRDETCRVGHAPDGKAPSRPPGRRAAELGRRCRIATTASTSSPTGTR